MAVEPIGTEVAEIRKNFTDSSGFFTLNHILTAYVDPQKNVLCKDKYTTKTGVRQDFCPVKFT